MGKLALLGGEKTVTLDYEKVGNIPLCTETGIEDAIALMKKGEISQSQSVIDFEKRFASYMGAKYALATNNGTSSLDSALFAVGVRPGDEVLVPSLTFWASMVPIIAQHATPVFCDIDRNTHCMDPADIERKITPKTRAIMLVHVWGAACDMDAIMAIARKHNIKVIEDCSHAHGTKYKGVHVGNFGDIGCYSLQGSKLLPAGEGGILITNNLEYYERCLAFGHYDRLADLPETSEYRKYMLTGMGHKYRPHPLAIALANRRLDTLDESNEIRNRNALKFEKLVSDLDWMVTQKVYDGVEKVFAYQYFVFDNTKFEGIRTFSLLKALGREGVSCGYCGYGRLHKSPLVLQGGPWGDCGPREAPVSLPETEYLAEHAFLACPRFETECDELIEQYAAAYHKIEENRDELIEFDRTHDFTEEMKNLSGRTIAVIK